MVKPVRPSRKLASRVRWISAVNTAFIVIIMPIACSATASWSSRRHATTCKTELFSGIRVDGRLKSGATLRLHAMFFQPFQYRSAPVVIHEDTNCFTSIGGFRRFLGQQKIKKTPVQNRTLLCSLHVDISVIPFGTIDGELSYDLSSDVRITQICLKFVFTKNQK